ncbi:hypothetical protein Acid7E03_38700 [Acidisoma sp. 7E03]
MAIRKLEAQQPFKEGYSARCRISVWPKGRWAVLDRFGERSQLGRPERIKQPIAMTESAEQSGLPDASLCRDHVHGDAEWCVRTSKHDISRGQQPIRRVRRPSLAGLDSFGLKVR